MKECACFAAVTSPTVSEHSDVSASTETATGGMIEYDGGQVVVALELGERVADREAHGRGQRVQCGRPVEPDPTEPTLLVDNDFAAHCRVNSRPTIMRMIWFVPSRMEWTRKSRQKRSIG